MLYFAPPRSSSVVRDWIPAALLLLAYWQIGEFVVKPNQDVQARLAAFDWSFFRAVHIQPKETSISPVPGLYLELAYLMVYPLVPLGVAALYIAGRRHYADYYWVVVLLATFTCFAVTPFVPALPPRSLTGYAGFEIPQQSPSLESLGTPAREHSGNHVSKSSRRLLTHSFTRAALWCLRVK